jgi:simple sugar transport system ATP-binding protein
MRRGHSQAVAPAQVYRKSEGDATLVVTDVSKRFGATQALDAVSLAVRHGEVHGLVGRNGAGKSTLAHIVAGVLSCDSGSIRFRGRDASEFRGPLEWRQEVAFVDQEGSLIPTMSVAENLFLVRYARRDGRWMNWRAMKLETQRRLDEWDLAIDPMTPAGDLDVEQHALVEIARTLTAGAKVIILDEPTARLERIQIVRLFEKIRALKKQGIAFVYISHHLVEIFELCDSVTVLRDGQQIPVGAVGDLDEDALVHAIVGDAAIAAPLPDSNASPSVGEQRTAVASRRSSARSTDGGASRYLETRELTIGARVKGVSFSVGRGECVGLAGVVGSGAEDVAKVIAGFQRPDSGEVLVDGKPLGFGDVTTSILQGVSSVPRERRREGIIPDLGVDENMTLAIMRRLGRFGLVMPRRRAEVADGLMASLQIVASSPGQSIRALSGGNQQKAMFGRALASNPSVLVLVSPTAGVDVASKAALLETVNRAREDSGVAVILVSDELDELRACDRVLVMFRGRITNEFDSGWVDDEIIAAMEGIGRVEGGTEP